MLCYISCCTFTQHMNQETLHSFSPLSPHVCTYFGYQTQGFTHAKRGLSPSSMQPEISCNGINFHWRGQKPVTVTMRIGISHRHKHSNQSKWLIPAFSLLQTQRARVSLEESQRLLSSSPKRRVSEDTGMGTGHMAVQLTTASSHVWPDCS